MKVCSEPGCPELQAESRCITHRRAKERARGSSTARGYGYGHKTLSAERRAAAIGSVCHFCGKTMLADQALALDHSEDRQSYRGVVHLSCNASDGAKRGNALRSRA